MDKHWAGEIKWVPKGFVKKKKKKEAKTELLPNQPELSFTAHKVFAN